jgi:hypothetical protein
LPGLHARGKLTALAVNLVTARNRRGDMTNSRHRRSTATLAALVGIPLMLALAACAPSDPTPRPTGTSTTSAIPGESGSPSPSPTPTSEETVDAATLVVTASTISVFGTDGSTLASETYRSDAVTVVAHLSEALGEEPTVTTYDGSEGGGCPGGTTYAFGGFELSTPATLGSAGSFGSGDQYSVLILGPATGRGISIETVAGLHIGSTRAEFEAAVGDEILIDEYGGSSGFGFDIQNPEAGPYDHIGVAVGFDGGVMFDMFAPALIGFAGDCG